jgi:hypothetical protein
MCQPFCDTTEFQTLFYKGFPKAVSVYARGEKSSNAIDRDVAIPKPEQAVDILHEVKKVMRRRGKIGRAHV